MGKLDACVYDTSKNARLKTLETRETAGGRPKDPGKRAAILAAARARFFARGLEATSIEEIAAAAGVSKVTVYGHFGDKETLMEAVIRTEASRMEAALLRPRPRGAPLAAMLNEFGETLLGFLAEPSMEACDRILSAAADRHPDLARRFFEAGPGYVHAQLTRVLADAAARGELAVDDPALAAEDLTGMWKGMWMLERRFGIHRARPASEISARVARATRLFMKAHAPPT